MFSEGNDDNGYDNYRIGIASPMDMVGICGIWIWLGYVGYGWGMWDMDMVGVCGIWIWLGYVGLPSLRHTR